MQASALTTSGAGSKQQHNKLDKTKTNNKMKQQQQQQKCKKQQQKIQLKCHESMLTNRLLAPKDVKLFEEFEELSKMYTIEAPYLSRSQMELVFDVYDGRKLATTDSLIDDEQQQAQVNEQQQQQQVKIHSKASLATTSSGSSSHHNNHKLSASTQQQQQQTTSSSNNKCLARRQAAGERTSGSFSWCKVLFNHKRRRRANCCSLQLTGCFNKSDTAQDLAGCLMSNSNSGLANSAGWWSAGLDPPPAPPTRQQASAALEPAEALEQALASEYDEEQTNNSGDDGDDEAKELRVEARQILAPLLSQLAGIGRNSSTMLTSSASQQERQAALVLAGEPPNGTLMDYDPAASSCLFASGVSVCLFNKRTQRAQLKLDAQNGRRWWFVEARLRELRWRLRGAWRTRELESKLDKFMSKRICKPAAAAAASGYHCDKSKKPTSSLASSDQMDDVELQAAFSEKLNKHQMEKLIELSKNSLNHLIDAQLLLRNKLANEQEQQQQQQQQFQYSHTQLKINQANEYELLLRNNFNLLKIWQNIEETKHLVCFVCEPIKANLNDIFWFNRKQIALNYNSGSQMVNNDTFVFKSPLVSLDSIQLKRGLLQILEALHYLHAICKLIHRNLTPANILIGSNDNWKLSGLEFALRFESATISESASIMAHEGASGSLLRYSLGSANAQQKTLRRQKTLHQTKCDEFARSHASSSSSSLNSSAAHVLQPQVDYLAPEIWKSAKCSHKSDIFSYGLILAQCYDLYRHRALICCRSKAQNYDEQLKKLSERRKRKASRLVPFEMRSVLMGMLDLEPSARPSANYALQLFRRPIELCKDNDDSLKHLRRSLAYLDDSNRFLSGSLNNNNNNNNNNLNAQQQQQQQQHKVQRFNYFRKVTSTSNQSASALKKQTKNLHLLNLLLRALDSLSNNNLAASMSSSQQHQPLSSSLEDFGQFQNHHLQQQQLVFPQLRQLFEYTFESLIQVYKLTTSTTNADAIVMCPDSRSLMLIVALHRQLLSQLAQMRAELPPVCRLTAANTQANRPTPNQRQLAELEERLHNLVSRHSMAKLAPALTDPLLKLDEFLLVYELVSDLLAFVGQKCRQNFIQRGRQLLNELTPVTGCPSLSSSDEEEQEEQEVVELLEEEQQQQQHQAACAGLFASGVRANFVVNQQQQQHNKALSSSIALAGSRETLNNFAPFNTSARSINSKNNTNTNKMNLSNNRFSAANLEYYEDQQQQQQQQQIRSSQMHQQQQQQQHRLQQATKISITAPSPRGSIRDVDRLISEPTINSTPVADFRHPAQRHNQQRASYADDHYQLAKQTSELSLLDSQEQLNNNNNNYSANNLNQDQEYDDEGASSADKSKSRSQLIDELLRTINDDSFNDFVDFNNKFSATQTGGANSNNNNNNNNNNKSQQLSAAQLANVGRPKSAIDGMQSSSSSLSKQYQQQQFASSSANNRSAAAAAAGQRPSTLALNTNQHNTNNNNNTNNNHINTQFQHHRHSTTPSTFDNVIRRMSTNFVQNFNKIGVSCTPAEQQQQQQPQQPQQAYQQQQQQQQLQQQDGLRREKSSTAYANNSLYVDNQVPARRHSDNTINIPRIQVALSSPSTPYRPGIGAHNNSSGSISANLNQRASASASKLANKWKLNAKSNQRDLGDKLSPNLSGALSYMRRHSSGNTTNGNSKHDNDHHHHHHSSSGQSNGHQTSHLLLNASPFKTKSSSNLGFDFLLSNRSMKRRYSAASMLGHQTQRKAEDLIDAGMKSVQNMFS